MLSLAVSFTCFFSCWVYLKLQRQSIIGSDPKVKIVDNSHLKVILYGSVFYVLCHANNPSTALILCSLYWRLMHGSLHMMGFRV